MVGVRKEFDKDLYTKYDGPAKEALEIHLKLTGHTVVVPPEDFGPDLYSYWGTRKMYHEVEVSTLWSKGLFPFPKGSIPERKLRLIDKVGGLELFFWMLRVDLGRALVFPSVFLNDKYLVHVPNKKVLAGEYFYRVPKFLGKEFDIATI